MSERAWQGRMWSLELFRLLIIKSLKFFWINFFQTYPRQLFKKLFSLKQALLELVHDIFEEQTSLDKVVHKIMRRALSMLKCERCSVLLLMHPVLGNSLAEETAQVRLFLPLQYTKPSFNVHFLIRCSIWHLLQSCQNLCVANCRSVLASSQASSYLESFVS